MAIDPQELAGVLEEFRLAHGNETKEAAAGRAGIGIRQYRRISNAHEPNPRAATLEKLAAANGVQLGWLMDRITHGDNTLTGRLQRLEETADQTAETVQQLLELWRDELLPRLADLELAATRTTPQAAARQGRTKRTAARRTAAS